MTDATKTVGGIFVSQQDARDYRALELDNGLRVLLVTDPVADKAAAAMDVGVGHLCDPEALPGLAHFLEHMLFLGTEKYPDESEYNKYLNAHGGRSNAFTSHDHTNYYFEVVQDSLEGALDRFAQFFIAPLFTESATEREMNAVDSENNKNLQDDQWRFNQLMKHAAREDHPYHKFGTGNLQTLRDSPQSKGLDTREALLAFHAQWYSANIMCLTIVARDDLDTLEGWARGMFTGIRNINVELPTFPGRPFGPDALGSLTRVAPVKEMRMVDLTFPLGPLRDFYLEKPANYVSHLVGHEGAGSILSLLKARGWANELSAGPGTSSTDWCSFRVLIECTEAGMEHVDDIIQVVFAYISMLRREGPQEWVWEESRTVAANAFRFKSKENPMSYASALAGRMRNYPAEHYVAGAYLLWEYSPDLIRSVLDQMTPDNVLVHVAATPFRELEGLVEEPWYGTQHVRSRVDAAVLASWSQPPECAALRLPPRNDLLPADFSIQDGPSLEDQPDAPLLLQDDDLMRLWYRFDAEFRKPKLSVLLSLFSPVAYESPRAAVLSDLLTRMLSDDLNEFSYMAEVAGLHYSFRNSVSGFTLSFRGYNHKLPVLVQRCCERLASLQIDPEKFLRMKERCRLGYVNYRQDQPYQHAVYSWSYLTGFPRWHHEDKIDTIDGISAADLVAFMPRLLSSLHVEGFVHGNATEEQARALLTTVRTILKPQALHTAQLVPQRAAALPAGITYLHQRDEQNAANENSAVQNYFQIGPDSPRLAATLDLFTHLCRERAFEQLRTQEQLGYLVFSGYMQTFGVLGWRLIVQSSHTDPVRLDERMEAFLGTFREYLAALTPEEFAEHKEAVIAKYLQKYKTVFEETQALWDEISSHYYVFRRRFVESDEVRTLELQDVLSFFDAHIAVGAPQRRKLSTQVFGKEFDVPTPEGPPPAGVVRISNDDRFKATVPLHAGPAFGPL